MKLFEPTSSSARIFALPPGCDFAEEFTQGLIDRLADAPPESMSQIEIYLNTNRVRRGIIKAFSERGSFLLPKLRLIDDLAKDVRFFDIAPPVPTLRRRLELFQAVSKLLETDARFAARNAAFDLADSLAELMDEMQEEGVSPETIKRLDVSQHSAHWEDSLRFLEIVNRFWGQVDSPDIKARLRLVIESLTQQWQRETPAHPVIIAGSTGSRGATNLLMRKAARLPQGAIVLPCFDSYLPQNAWDQLIAASEGEDHPQFRLASIVRKLEVTGIEVKAWRETCRVIPERNRLMSLALRPAPVTNQWLSEGPRLKGIDKATENITLLEAPHPRAEAIAIAFRLRHAAEFGERAALVTTDRNLAKQVTAALARWNIVPEDGFDIHLTETVSGRLLLLTADLMGQKPDPVGLISLLRHPCVHAIESQEQHLWHVERLEGAIRRHGLAQDVNNQVAALFSSDNVMLDDWSAWLTRILDRLETVQAKPLQELVRFHLRIIEDLVTGTADTTNPVVSDHVSKDAYEFMRELEREGSAGGILDCDSYRHLLRTLAQRRTLQDPHPRDSSQILIWNTLDARMQSPDLVIAGGLNEGTWPAAAPVDPWLNRSLRHQAGLLMPERRIGLLAHDFQQVACVPEVVLSRSERYADEPAVPCRWLIRLTTLLAGIGDQGTASLDAMRARGRKLLDQSRELDRPQFSEPPAPRPNPRPPVAIRPKSLPVTAVKTLISNPYEIYARQILKLRELDPLEPTGFATQRGTALHDILQKFVKMMQTESNLCTTRHLLDISRSVFAPLPIAPRVKQAWLGQLEQIADEFVAQELVRAKHGVPVALEVEGSYALDDVDFTLTARVDRIDKLHQGGLAVYDYKTGSIPTNAEINRRDKQIPLTVNILEQGGFLTDGPPDKVKEAAYIACGKTAEITPVNLECFADTLDKFRALMKEYQNPSTGYLSRRNMNQYGFGQAFDHLARYGEWDDTDPSSELDRDG
ncbi:MAG: double-strand break repair protein AddB [Rhodobacteraceae bacterium]|nr:double-strand break repair protein AddB [Paracoccaceae bacterium]MCY4197315.1 double-strand break repair protein AddB [Paracoccaceae bacterium]